MDIVFADAFAQLYGVGLDAQGVGVVVVDGVLPGAQAEQVGVGALPAFEGVIAGAAIKDVIPRVAV